MSLAIGLPLLLLVLVLQGFFSGSEMAMVNANRLKLQTRAEEGHKGAALALRLLDNEDVLLGTCLIGTNLCVVSGATLARLLLNGQGISSEVLITLLFTPVVLIFGEALPKTVLQFYATKLAPVLAVPLTFVSKLFSPALALVNLWNRALFSLTGGEPPDSFLTRNDLLEMLGDGEEGPIDDDERRLIRSVLAFTDRAVLDVMTPLVRVEALQDTLTVGAAINAAVNSSHSRLPVYDRRIDNIIGLIHQTDLLFAENKGAELRSLMKPIRFVPEAKSAEGLFKEMRELGEHFVVVVDEYGGCVGIVTLEDLLEEVVGNIEDERDDRTPTIIKLSDGTYSIPAQASILEVERFVNTELPEGSYETIAGLLLHLAGNIPQSGEVFTVQDHQFRIEEATERSIVRVTLREISENLQDSTTSPR